MNKIPYYKTAEYKNWIKKLAAALAIHSIRCDKQFNYHDKCGCGIGENIPAPPINLYNQDTIYK